MSNFRPVAPIVPQLPDVRQNTAVRALEHAHNAVASSSKANGRLTSAITLGTHGTTQHIDHGLGRAPVGFDIGHVIGFPPKYRVTGVDSKRITIVSLDQVDVCGMFVTSPGGAVSSGSGVLWSAKQSSTGVYTVTLPFECSDPLSAGASSNAGNASWEMRYTSSTFGANGTIVFTNYVGTTPTNLASMSCLFHAAVTGTKPKFKWWVY